MNKPRTPSWIFAFLAAALYALSTPISKLLLDVLSPAMIASLLYLGAGIGMAILGKIQRKFRKGNEQPLGRQDLPSVIGMILLDILAPLLLMFGLQMTTAENASLLNNFEIVATSVIALTLFREKISRSLGVGIVLVTFASLLLSLNDLQSFSFSAGSLLVLAAATCWGLENNLTRKLSSKDPLQIVVVKGLFSGLGAFLVALFSRSLVWNPGGIAATLGLGFVAYGLSIYFYVYSQRHLGAAKTSAFYAVAPFIGVIFAFLIFQEIPGWWFFLALGVMALGTLFAARRPKSPVPGADPTSKGSIL